ncbi:MAG: hypothetical protein IPJ46_18155 [Anaerolineales bacterium]|nr:hypothetical protein [Anaerolineales bacterium]
MQRVLYIAGGLFILYLAYGTYDSRKNFDSRLPSVETGTQQSILKAALLNALLQPAYFWTLVTGPILLKGWRGNSCQRDWFSDRVYVTLISSLAALILIFGTAAKLGQNSIECCWGSQPSL